MEWDAVLPAAGVAGFLLLWLYVLTKVGAPT